MYRYPDQQERDRDDELRKAVIDEQEKRRKRYYYYAQAAGIVSGAGHGFPFELPFALG